MPPLRQALFVVRNLKPPKPPERVKYLILFTAFILTYSSLLSQRLNNVYRGLSSDTTYSDHLLEFESDSTLEVRTFPRHMSQGFRKTFKYRKFGKTIELIEDEFSRKDSSELVGNGFGQFLHQSTFTIDGTFLIDEEHKMLYALNKKFEKQYFIIYIIDNKKYKQETSSTDAYGLLRKNLKENTELRDTLASLNNKMDKYSIKVYKGLSAYRKFGRKYIYGVVVLQQKE